MGRGGWSGGIRWSLQRRIYTLDGHRREFAFLSHDGHMAAEEVRHHMAVDVEMCVVVQELRMRERQLAEKARDIKASPRTHPHPRALSQILNDMHDRGANWG